MHLVQEKLPGVRDAQEVLRRDRSGGPCSAVAADTVKRVKSRSQAV